jgi:hypothetical protein
MNYKLSESKRMMQKDIRRQNQQAGSRRIKKKNRNVGRVRKEECIFIFPFKFVVNSHRGVATI